MITGTHVTVDGRPGLRFERRLPHPVERVWRAITEPDELRAWFPAVPRWELRDGAEFTDEHGNPGGRLAEVRPPRLLAYSWGSEDFRFELEPDGAGCRLVFVHVVDDAALVAQHAAGWETYLARLDAHLAGGALSEVDAHAPIAELHERYAQSLGVDPGPGRRMVASMGFRDLTLEAGPAVRLERRYAHPAERLWRALTDPEELRGWFPSGEELVVTESDPPRLLAGTWYGDELRFELRPEGDGCVLAFTHAFADRDTAARTAAGWDRCFARVDALLAGVAMSERESLELWPDVHERYARTFGVDPEVGRQAFAAHPLT